MTASTPQSPPSPTPPAAGLDRQRWRQRLGALVFLLLGGLLLASNLHLLPPVVQRVVGWAWPAVLVGAGVWVLLAWRPRAMSAEPTAAFDRAGYTAGELVVSAGTADMRIGALAAGSQLALGRLPTPRDLVLTPAAGTARLRLTPGLAGPLFGSGAEAIDLAPDLPWMLQWRSSLGDLTLDLRGLDLTVVQLGSPMGQVDLTLPEQGQADLTVRLGLGNLTLRVPEKMAVKVKVNRGRLATVQPDARRFVQLAPGEWSTPLFAVSPARCTVTVYLWAGDLTLV